MTHNPVSDNGTHEEDQSQDAQNGTQGEPGATETTKAADDSGEDTTDTQGSEESLQAEDDGGAEPTYEELLADRDHWRTMAEAAGAGKAAAEAAKYRSRLREAERERDGTRDSLTIERDDALATAGRLRDHAATGELERAGLDLRLLALAGRTVDEFLTDDGLVDGKALVEALRPIATDLGVSRPRRPQPNPLAGRGNGAGTGPTGKQVWDSVFGVQR